MAGEDRTLSESEQALLSDLVRSIEREFVDLEQRQKSECMATNVPAEIWMASVIMVLTGRLAVAQDEARAMGFADEAIVELVKYATDRAIDALDRSEAERVRA